MEVRVRLVALHSDALLLDEPVVRFTRTPTRISSPIYTNSRHGTRIQL